MYFNNIFVLIKNLLVTTGFFILIRSQLVVLPAIANETTHHDYHRFFLSSFPQGNAFANF